MIGIAESDSLAILKERIASLTMESEELYRVATLQKYGYYIIAALFVVIVVLFALYYFELMEIRNKNKALSRNIERRNRKNESLELLKEKIRRTGLYLKPDCSRESLCQALGMTQSGLSESLKEAGNMRLHDVLVELRLEDALSLLKDASKRDTIENVAFKSGFNNARTLQRHFKSKYGLTPKEYRNV